MPDQVKGFFQGLFKSPVIISIPIVLAIVGATWRVGLVLQSVTNQMTTEINTVKIQINNDLTTMNGRIDKLNEDKYPLSLASERALRTAIENPGMRVPDPRDPSQIITVRLKGDE